MNRVFEAIRLERKRQDAKWGTNAIRTVGRDSRLCILAEEVGEVAEICNRMRDEGVDLTSELHKELVALTKELRKELVQVASVAVAWLEIIDLHYDLDEATCASGPDA